MSQLPLDSLHPDYPEIAPLVAAIFNRGGGFDVFAERVPALIRQAFDEVIDTPRTDRFTLAEIENSEKAYLETKIAILLRNYLKIPKGRVLAMRVMGVEVDIKSTVGGNWTVSTVSRNQPTFLVRADEKKALCDVGMVILRPDYVTISANREDPDAHKKLAAGHDTDIWWMLRSHAYPRNHWEVLSGTARNAIMSAGGGKNRIAALFETIQRQPISRLQVQTLAQQHDYMKRIRRNGGARDLLAPKGIALLWGQGDRSIIEALRLGPVTADEFISVKPRSAEEESLLRQAGHID